MKNSQKCFRLDHDDEVKALLRRVFRYSDDRRDVDEACEVLGVSQTTFYSWMSPESRATISACALATLSRWMIEEYHDTRIVAQAVPHGSVVMPPVSAHGNGTISDEVEEINMHLGSAISAWKAGDLEAVERHAQDMVGAISAMMQEVKS